MENYVIVDETGRRIVNENGLTLVQNVADKSLIYAKIAAENILDTNESCLSSSSQKISIDEKNSKWMPNAIVALIHEYKNKMSMFQSSTIRKEAVWKIISTNLGQQNFNYTPKQCEFKFKNLKKKYHAKIDNMKATASGAAPIKFEYFDLFNDMFGHKPNVIPLTTASSSRGQGIELDTDLHAEDVLQDNNEEKKENTQIRKRTSEEIAKKHTPKKTKLDPIFLQLDHINHKREEEKNKRHKELIAVQENAYISALYNTYLNIQQ